MKFKLLLVIVCVLCASVYSFAMDEENYTSEKKLSSYNTLVINDFDINNVEFEHIDNDEMKTLKPMMPLLVKGISEAVQKKLAKEKKFSNIELNGKQTRNTVRLEGKILKLNGGIGGVKWLLGFMAPKNAKTFISISGRLVDAESGKELGTFADINTGMVYTKNFADYFPEMSEQLGESIAEFITNN